MTRFRHHTALASLPLLLAAVPGCHAPAVPLAPASPIPVDTQTYALFRPGADVVHRIILIGDAGEATDNDPVMLALHQVAGQHASTTVLFLGDNVYPCGVTQWSGRPPLFCRRGQPSAPPAEMARVANAQARARLETQMRALSGTRAEAYFIPGNHDWYGDTIPGPRGTDAVIREANLIARWRDSTHQEVYLRPEGTCPGPEAIDRPRVRIIILDTQRLMRINEDSERRTHRVTRPAGCRFWLRSEVREELRRLVREARADGREVMVASHHPPVTYGTHCPPFLPRTGKAALTRGGRVFTGDRTGPDQDVRVGQYDLLRRFMAETFQTDPPFIWAGGHSHGLERIRTGEITTADARRCAVGARAAANILVSGAGSNDRGVRTGPGLVPDTLRGKGFLILDVSPTEFRVRVLRPDHVPGRDGSGTQAADDAVGYVLTR